MIRRLRLDVHLCLLALLCFLPLGCGGGSSNTASTSTPGTSSNGNNSSSSGSQPGTGSSSSGSGSSSSGGSGSSSSGSSSGSSSSGSGSSGGSSGSGSGASSSGGQYVYIGDTNNLQIDGFKLNSDGTLTAVPGSPFQMPGQGQTYQSAGFTLAVVGQFLFANATAGGSGLAGFKIDPATGSLTAVNTATNTNGTWFVLAGNSQQNVLYASGSVTTGNGGSNGLVAFAVNSDGSLKVVSTPTSPQGQEVAGAIAVDHQGRFLFSWSQGQIYVFGLNSDGSMGSQVSGSPFAISKAYQPTSPSDPNACFGANEKPILASDVSGRFLYASCDASAQVDEIAVSSSGQLSLIGTVPSPGSGTELSSLIMSGDGAFLFGTEEEANSVVSFAVDRSSGKLTTAGTISAGTRPNQAAIDASNHYLYVTNGSSNVSKNDYYPGSNNVSEYAVNAGVMTPLPDSPKTVGSRPGSVIAVKF